MVDTASSKPPERQRIKKLAQAALNADMTVEQLEGILADMGEALEGLGPTMSNLDATIEKLDATLVRMSGTLDQVDATVDRMSDVVARLERVVARVEVMVGIGEAALRPLGMLESAGKSVVARLGLH
ncbi:hypothetical protein M0655_21700 [Gordonia amicalis]|uniref:ATPase n=1 Tax=Gordonia amicalis TaxID=89053 RepID=A0AAE4R086_9ACTN|nr:MULTISPECIES: hypothetical protein [Gordonia]MCZ4578215.1 hypothetical protein [Gordonia amicalis]MCZ4652795.1 hypothetical protein [Gordonia amicalis]MDV6311015.1 hypothetical protein [Gordonia amicalis]UPW13792.1 hypothetical protein M0655_21700 [Gordonia amicalis]